MVRSGWEATNCASCHGVDGQGEPNWKTPKEDGTYPAPPQTADGHTWHHADDLLLDLIANGRVNTAMEGFSAEFSEEEMRQIVQLLRRWQ